ncbi:hypothetical protein ABZY90_19625 [Streptomyces sp. NPDC006422]|uniref:hypothetical protein n=1 Tax=unclassified Streptomyces TaxID=2593676 RepID=UPI0033BC5536
MDPTHPTPADEAPPSAAENRIVSEPATVEACQADYALGAAERHSSAQRDAHAGGAR